LKSLRRRRAAEVIRGAAGGLDPGIRATRTIREYAPLFLRHHRVEGTPRTPMRSRCGCTWSRSSVAAGWPRPTGPWRTTTSRCFWKKGVSNTIRQAKVVLCAMFGKAVADGYVDYNPFHDVKIPKVPGRRAIRVATPGQYLTVRACLPTRPARVFSTLLVSSGMRFCEAVGLQPADFDFDADILEVARSVVKVTCRANTRASHAVH
jgi:integrase